MDYKHCAYCKKSFLINNEELVFCSPICREKRNKSRNDWNQKNKEHIKFHHKEWYQQNKKHILRKAKERREKNPEYMENWRKENEEHIKEYVREYTQIHREHINKRNTEYRNKNKEKNKQHNREYFRKYQKEREERDISFKLARRIRHRIYLAIKNNSTSSHIIEKIGCNIEEYKQHLEKQFKPGMSWSNWNFYGWHIDHIKPCSSFDLNDPEEVKKCFHYSNAQPLWAHENLSKGDSYETKV